MGQRKPRGAPNRRCMRFRVGRVSVYFHHAAWWLYYRENGVPIRRRVGLVREEAERLAAEIHAQLTVSAPTMLAFTPISVTELQQQFLSHHEQVLRSSIATISRYRTAIQHLVDYAGSQPAHQVSTMSFVTFLRNREVSPNGHAHSAKRRLRDKGVQFILETCRAMYAFAQRQRHLPPYAANPFAELRLDRMRIEDAKGVFVFDEATEGRFLQAASDWEFPIQFTLAKTGMRPGELCHLLIEELELERGWLQIRNKPELGWSVKTRNERSIPLVEELRLVLRQVVGSREAGVVFQRPRFEVHDTPRMVASHSPGGLRIVGTGSSPAMVAQRQEAGGEPAAAAALPYPEPGVRLIKQEDLSTFDEQLQIFRADLGVAVSLLQNRYAELTESARARLGELFNPRDYPESLLDEFAMTWEFPTVEPPEYLRRLNPALGAKQLQIVDFDHVDESNITTQGYLRSELGLPKVAALGQTLMAIEPELHLDLIPDRFRPHHATGDVVFCCVDSIENAHVDRDVVLFLEPRTAGEGCGDGRDYPREKATFGEEVAASVRVSNGGSLIDAVGRCSLSVGFDAVALL